ncbi:disease resistance-like protein DSC1 [Neltuma alba]|uniref:disease resistance-like protein DSC1 n=1 Tax=Neltuma alba TaxID=207710 RepID=UPI0010A43569|nr:disease resistance-like protein DSC1 [Prosopis alba]
MSTFTTSSKVRQEKYDVFVSFRGSDIRHGFLSHLTRQLRLKGIDVYEDERLERGDEISSALSEAIERSRIALVIFSTDYASSRWCLEELEKIMECKRVNNQIVIPVFYNVDPSHVRHQEGSYAYSFAQHKQKFKDNLLQFWRSVLKETANLSGYHHSSNFQNESDLIDGIIKDVSKKLEGKDTIEPKHLIGIEENFATIESFMKDNSQKVGVLGIWGKGGIGKTTLAHATFDKFSQQFDSSCFAANVREESKKIGLTRLLEEILSILLKDESILKIDGMPNIQRRLRRTRVLLVLDDVDTPSQLQYLIDENLSLGASSKVIITSRDRHVLISGGVHEVHEVKELSKDKSLQLFCRYAFKQGHPKQGYEKLSLQVIEYAKGLPLALKVLGSYLNSRNTKAWESALKKLRKYPNREIQTVLRVSYDGLDIPEKELFLNIAFFFRGEKKEDIMRVLDACDHNLYVDIGIDRLLDKALIIISRGSRVEIHDMLQEMAEEIVREESREHPESRNRLNDAKEVQDILENNKGTDIIEGIALNPHELKSDIHLSADAFSRMSNLRFLKIDRNFQGKYQVLFPFGLESLPNKLRYFCWNNYPLETLPLGFCANKLVEIQMPCSDLVKLWDGVQKLKELPSFFKAQNLEIMDFGHCKSLCSIHPSILSLPKLVSLNLEGCNKLKNLHGDNHLKSLKELKLTGCFALEEFLLSSKEMRSLHLEYVGIETLNLPVGRFNKLEELYLSGPLRSFQVNELSCLTSLKKFVLFSFEERIEKSKLVTLFDAWRSLEELYLTYCVICEIPDNISAMSLLKSLSLRGSNVKSLPNSIKHLSELREIDLGECKRLRSLPELPPSLAYCYLNECQSLETFTFPLMRAIHNSGEVRFCYPGSTIPEGFKYSHTTKRSISIELAPTSSNHLLGFASCCILSASATYILPRVDRKFHFEDEKIYYRGDNKLCHLKYQSTDNVLLWYDPVDHMLNENQRRRFDEGATYKFACEFFSRDFFGFYQDKSDDMIKGCGIWPIYASEIQEKMELRLEMGAATGSTSQHPNAEVSQHQPARDSVRRSTRVRQRIGNLTTMPYSLRTKRGRNERTARKDNKRIA